MNVDRAAWAKGILDEVKANLAKLEACPGPHDFIAMEPEKVLTGRHRCSICGGEISLQARNWYARGLAHGRK